MSHPGPTELGREFVSRTQGHNFKELNCFRALIDSIRAANEGTQVEEYHGRRSKVAFDGALPWTDMPIQRCELSDLCIVWYRTRPHIEGRVTFLQAKFSTNSEHYPCIAWPEGMDEEFKATTWQWHLLHTRPIIHGAHQNFQPAQGLLHDALLASVGSFGIFHYPVRGGPAGFFYGAADVVQARAMAKGRTRPHGINTHDYERCVAGHREQVWCCCIDTFSHALFNGLIGTPFRKRGEAAAARINEDWNSSFLLHLSGDIIGRLNPTDANWNKFHGTFQASAPSEEPISFKPLARTTLLIDADAYPRVQGINSILRK